MQSSRNPAKSRPLSANIKRLMQLARASPQNPDVIKVSRPFTERDLAYCHKQGNLFMEAASMGFSMEDFAPLFMTSQLAGVFDVSFSASSGMENDALSNLLRIPKTEGRSFCICPLVHTDIDKGTDTKGPSL